MSQNQNWASGEDRRFVCTVDVDQALAWLDDERGTSLSPATRNRMDNFSAEGLTTPQRRSTVLALLRTAANLPDPFEQAEVFAYCGVFFYRLMQMHDAIRWLQQANDYYQYLEDPHRQACTSWMLYQVMRASGQYRKAYNYGRRARLLFNEKALQYKHLQNPGRESWYQGREVDFTVCLISTIEDAYELLFEFNGTRMSPSAMQVKDRAQDHLEQRMFNDADQDLQVLLEITNRSRECAETAEAMAYSGVAEWLMEQKMNALYYFRASLTQYVPTPHEYAVVTWMLGLAEWSFPDLRARSIVTLEKTIQKMGELRESACSRNETAKYDWYAMHHIAMRRVLTHLIE